MKTESNVKQFFLPLLLLTIFATCITAAIMTISIGNQISNLQGTASDVFFKSANMVLGGLIATSIPGVGIAGAVKLNRPGWCIYLISASGFGLMYSFISSTTSRTPQFTFFYLLLLITTIPILVLSIIQLTRANRYSREIISFTSDSSKENDKDNE